MEPHSIMKQRPTPKNKHATEHWRAHNCVFASAPREGMAATKRRRRQRRGPLWWRVWWQPGSGWGATSAAAAAALLVLKSAWHLRTCRGFGDAACEVAGWRRTRAGSVWGVQGGAAR